MNCIRSFVRAGVAAMIVAAGTQSSAVAQPMEVALPPQAPQTNPRAKAPETRLIQVRNVQVDMMAWWLDPVRNAMPPAVSSAYEALKMSGQPVPERLMPEMQEDVYTAAKGLISFAPVAVHNILMVYGSEEGIRSFEEIVKSLDKPVTQLEIEAKFVQLSPEDATSLNIEFPVSTEKAPLGAHQSSKQLIGFARGDIHAQVDALVQQGKAKVINSPRVTTMNNLNARLMSMMSVPVVMGVKDKAGEFKPIFDSSQDAESGRISIGTAFGLSVTPSVQDDEVISLTIGPYKSLHVVVHDANGMIVPRNSSTTPKILLNNPFLLKKLAGKQDAVKVRATENLFLKNLEGELTTAKVRDGQTLVITGLNAAAFPYTIPGQENTVSKQASNVILLVTPRVLRRTKQ